jgi:hypothetical protein
LLCLFERSVRLTAGIPSATTRSNFPRPFNDESLSAPIAAMLLLLASRGLPHPEPVRERGLVFVWNIAAGELPTFTL